jgi:Uma2 family endonuclease
MSKAENTNPVSIQTYLENELTSEIRHEYVDGYLYPMSGASVNHGRISTNITRIVGTHLMNSPCELFSVGLKVKTSTGKYRYPDNVVICDDTFVDNGQVTQTPKIIVEVLSRSTRRIDEKAKQLEYINIPSLEEYVLIEQDIVDIRVLRKSDDWRTTHYFLGETLTLESIDFTLTVEDIYQRVDNQDMADFLTSK